jgi:uncharacterized protein YcfL
MQRQLAALIALFLLAGCSSGPAVDRSLTTRDQDSRSTAGSQHSGVRSGNRTIRNFPDQAMSTQKYRR